MPIKEKLQKLQEKAANFTLLYVEDDPVIREHYSRFLGKFFTHIKMASDGEEGLRMAQEVDFDLIISDIVMPHKNGIEMVKQIKKQKPQQAVILVSAYSDAPMLQNAIDIGVDGYLFKPLHKEKSVDLLYKVLTSLGAQKREIKQKAALESLVTQKTQELLKTYSIDKVTQLYSFNKLQQDISKYPEYSIGICKLQGFKAINDIYGYDAGDSLLLQTASTLQEGLRKELRTHTYSLYRASGTHFVILADASSDKLFETVQKVVQLFESSEMYVGDETLFIEMDAAVVDQSCETSLSNADKALRESKEQKRIILYRENIYNDEEKRNRIKCKEHLSNAINENRIVPYYQPIISNTTHQVVKFEALARMILESGEVVSPAYFLPIAKESKLYHNITHAIISQALSDFRDLPYSLSLNLSTIDIHNQITREFIVEELQKFPQPQRVVFEILESEEMHSYKELQEFITQMQSLGAKVAIDDFGSGYSNFSYLSKLNVDYVKIDGSLISELSSSFASKTIVEMLSNFAAQMGIKTIAEFVSSQEINDLVLSLRLDESQGYHFAQPLPLSEALAALS